MLKKKSILDLNPKYKKIIIRVDFNVSIKDGIILDDTRIRETIPTLKFLLKNKNSLVIMSHLGRPKGVDQKYTMEPVARRLEKYLKQNVVLYNHLTGNEKPKEKIVMLENVRFDPGDEQNDPKYAKLLSSFGEIFVNDAFGTAHRAHASTVGITKFLPAYAGLLMIKEINILSKVLFKPDRPVVSIISGAKISDKIGLIKKQLDHAQTVMVGGGIANTFLMATGSNIGCSLYEKEAIEIAKKLLFEAASKHSALILPIDCVAVDTNSKEIRTCNISEICQTDAIMDIGPRSKKLYCQFIQDAATIIFNGPVGKYEEKPFHKGTVALIIAAANSKALSVVGGGDTLAAIPNKKVAQGLTHISTGGGAMLEFIERGSLPGIDALKS